MSKPLIVAHDPWLEPYSTIIDKRVKQAVSKEDELTNNTFNLNDFASGYLYFGLHKTSDGWVLREWAPHATRIFLVGSFNSWQEKPAHEMASIGNGNWEIKLGRDEIKHGDYYKLIVYWPTGKGERIPAWARYVEQDPVTYIFNARVWDPEQPYQWKNSRRGKHDAPPIIYEAHVGMAQEKEGMGTYKEFMINVLPRIAEGGYNTIQLMAIQEHPYYGSFGYHVSNFFAASSRFGTPWELKELIDAAHGYGLAVIMDIVHSHAVKNEVEGLGRYDGSLYQFFHDGYRREHVAWDSLCFNYGKNEVLHFLLSNCKFWLEEYQFDGYRFDGVTSMLYLDHGLSRSFSNYNMYYDGNQDEDAITYFILANKLIHQVHPGAITVAEEMSGMPGVAASIENGGLGFDYRLAMGIPDYWIKTIKEKPDENWNVSEIFHELVSRRWDEKTVGYCESHDQALVGDKTIIFRLIDKEMYYNMHKSHQNLIIDRGLALHKMIRLITIASAGGSYLNFMGNEFGHPEWIDFPRQGNNWSYKYARRQWSLVDNKELKYHYLGDFDRDMINLIKNAFILESPYCNLKHDNQSDQVLAFERNNHYFVFNFNPTTSYTDYGIRVDPGRYQVVLNTDSAKYGGFNRVEENMVYYPQRPSRSISDQNFFLKLYLPSRTALVLKRNVPKSVY
jgi:1,4-alpha-glucan branching enzyme